MKKSTIYLVISLLCTCSIYGDLLTLSSATDTHIRGDGGNNVINFGDEEEILLGHLPAGAGDRVLRGLFSFDLSDPLLTGATINSVTLTFTVNSVDSPASLSNTETLQLFELDSTFVENQATWEISSSGNSWTSSGGDFSGGALASGTANPATVAVDDSIILSGSGLTSLVQSSLGSEIYTLGKLLDETPGDPRSLFRLDSSETPSGTGPFLTIDYTAVPEPGSLALLGVSMMAILLYGRKSRFTFRS